jgi:single-strand DNA-binding protein
MPGLPEVTMTGTLTADPELRFTQGGHAVVSFTVACNDRKRDAESGKWVDGDATFVRCNLWRQAAENVAESLTRGNRVIVVGQLKQRSYETKDGEKRTVFELEVTEVGPSLKFATAKVNKAERSAGGSRQSASADDPWGSAPVGGSGGFADEPPF